MFADAAAQVGRARGKVREMFLALNPRERLFVAVGVACITTFMALLAVFHESIINWMVGFSTSFRTVKMGWIIILLLLFTVSFPPLIGYSVISMFTGMVYGFPGGWPLLAAGTLFGSFLCFVVFRMFFEERAKALAQSNVKLMAFAKTLEQDNITLLWMIRLCPLPYSLSNAAMSSVHTVTPLKFFIATALTTPKLLLHIFIGDRLARLGTSKDNGTKVVNLISIAIALVVGVITSYIIYKRTMQRAAEIEEQQHRGGAGAVNGTTVDARELDEFEISDDDGHSSGAEELASAPSHRLDSGSLP